ncbi:selenocysteine-specific translation elongation factor [Alkaliphilus oremlandii]|uniref:Selenocysteine-specific elongation factor n=1 Tax=Alkaliphilus oremlandii (strain OhILAs) TaxID=350688 RepID=A8MHJ3_ALKOO|nr:selenocysteine-specific translation elongation factor [Alkaliphilus oremlandii]ABW19275.1 selenocysteine-specific translation elongation factor [Alkaliphilus oremlandii OhILAs]
MKNIVIGTSGHIDHGKTTLIKALTGRETDRLNEEKKRGISIELGFTYFDLPSGKRAGIIDVPGHEKFIRNMLAGVSGMDIVLLVVAADEGVMPQTKEHLDILSLLKIEKGIIVITKASLVDDEWVELVKLDIIDKVKDTFLEGTEIISVDSVKGVGIEELILKIDQLTDETESRDISAPFRMPIDRIFTITGFGTVVTGTIMEGKVSVEDTIEILPEKIKVRIRNIQVHGKSVDTAYAGQRVAINLANIKKEEIERGEVLAQVNSMEPTMMIDATLKLLKDLERPLKNRDRVRLYYGSSETFARVTLLNEEQGVSGQKIYVQFRLETPGAVKKGDHMIVRWYSPMETIGGAIVIDGNPKKHKRFDENVMEDLATREAGKQDEIVEKQIDIHSNEFPELWNIAKFMSLQLDTLKQVVEDLILQNKVVMLGPDHVIHIKYYEKIKNELIRILDGYHAENPLKPGMMKEEARSKLFPKNKSKVIDILFNLLVENKIIKVEEKFIALYDFNIIFSKVHEDIKNHLEKIYLEDPYSTPRFEDIVQTIGFKKEEVEQVFGAILGQVLIKLNDEVILHIDSYENAKRELVKYIDKNGSISLSEFRDILNTSRKYAVALLEHLDNIKFTKRIDEKRILY